MAGKVVVYSTSTCPWCHRVKEFLKENNIEFEEKDVSDPANAEEAVKRSGQMGVPITFIGEGDDPVMITGFNKEEFDKALEK